MNDPRGTIWRRWDLHVHTPASVLNSNFTGTDENEKWNLYFEKLASIRDVSVIGVTDYFSIDGYKKVLAYCRENPENLKNIDLFLPNVELRVLPVTADNVAINLHVIFSSDEEVISNLDSQFFSNLEFSFNNVTYKCTRSDLVNLGKAYLNEPSAGENRAYQAGVEQFKSDLNLLKKIFSKNERLRKNSVVVISNSSSDGASGIQHSSLAATRQELYRFADAIFSGNPTDHKYFLGHGTDAQDTIKRKYGLLKPCIHGSDAHELERICKPDLDRFTWIKADPAFEGLKQIIYEPEERVKVQKENPSESEAYAKIGKAHMQLPVNLMISDESGEKTDFCVRGEYDLHFSNNLTCIIGGRGSGKSTIVHLMYNSQNQEAEVLKKINSPLLNLDLTHSPVRAVADGTDCEVPTQTEFFFQNEIERAAKNVKQMSDLIRRRLERLSSIGGESLEERRVSWQERQAQLDDLINAYDQIAKIDNQIILADSTIKTLTKQTQVITSDEYKTHQAAVRTPMLAISSFNSYQEKYAQLIKQITNLKITIDKLKWDDSQGKDILIEFKGNIETYEQRLVETFNTYKKVYDDQNFMTKLTENKTQLETYLQDKGLAPENVQELANANQEINELQQTIERLNSEKQPHSEVYQRRTELIENYKLAYTAYMDRLNDTASSLQGTLAGLQSTQKEIRFSISADDTELKKQICSFVKEALKDETTLRSDVIERVLFFDVNSEEYVDDSRKIRQHVNEISGAEKHAEILRELINDDVFLEQLCLRIAKHRFDISNLRAQTKLGGTLLQNTSFGERCGIVISIILAAGTNPILIDQPEDHLDGKFISTILVPLIRKQKHNRQIVLITRDANIVIGGDSELIHILEASDTRTEICPTSIENVQNREKYIWLLDGGTEAFRTREHKYDIEGIKTANS